MKKLLIIGMFSVALTLIGAGSLTPVYAAGEEGDQGAGGMAQGQQLSGVEVTGVNKDQGTVQIRREEGQPEETVTIDPAQRAQLDEIQEGDRVNITMVERNGERVATQISKAG